MAFLINIALPLILANQTQWVFERCNRALTDGHPFMCSPIQAGPNLFDCEAQRRAYKKEGYLVTGCKMEETE